MLGRTALIAGALFLLLAGAVPMALADQNLLSNQQYQMSGKNTIVHIIAVNIVDKPMSNVMPNPDMKYYQIIYNFTNIGGTTEKAYIQPELIDANGDKYRDLEYTSIEVLPGHTSDNNFMEMAIPKSVKITEINFIEGFDSHPFTLTYLPSTPTPAAPGTPTPAGTQAAGGFDWAGCLPLIPFAMAGGVAGVGIVINRCGLRKR